MRRRNEEILNLEENITESINLLEAAKCYCEFNHEKGKELLIIRSLIERIIKEQVKIADKLDVIYS